MARRYKRCLGARTYRNYSEATLHRAIEDVKAKKLTIRQAAQKYGIPKNSLHLKIHEKNPNKFGRLTVFSEEEELKLVGYIVEMSKFGFPVGVFDLRCIAKAYLDRVGREEKRFQKNFPGRDWAEKFLQRHKNVLTQRTAKNISYTRAACDKEIVNQFFDNLEVELAGIPPGNLWNFDETTLQEDPGKEKIVTKRGTKYPERIQNSSKANTSICGNAAGELAPIYVNYKAEKLWTTWTENGPPGARYNRSKSGWFDSHCFEDWFVHTMLPILRRQEGQKALLGDNLSSHINLEVLRLCEQHQIKFIALPPNATHLLQPLDVAYFRPMKVRWRKILSEWKASSEGSRSATVPKDQFPALLKKLWDNLLCTGSADTLKAGFRKAGLHPLDRNIVLQRLPSFDNSMSTEETSVLGECFLQKIENLRKEITKPRQTKRRKKLDVPAGKSIGARDVQDATDEPQPSTSKKSKPTKRQRKEPQGAPEPDASSSEEDDVLPYCDSDDSLGSEDFSDLQSSKPGHKNPSPALTDLREGRFVLVNYEGELYPGKITKIVSKREIRVSAMTKIGANWKWPTTTDEISYAVNDIVQIINDPKKVGRREIFDIPELGVYLVD